MGKRKGKLRSDEYIEDNLISGEAKRIRRKKHDETDYF